MINIRFVMSEHYEEQMSILEHNSAFPLLLFILVFSLPLQGGEEFLYQFLPLYMTSVKTQSLN